jgi:hypothetical protein
VQATVQRPMKVDSRRLLKILPSPHTASGPLTSHCRLPQVARSCLCCVRQRAPTSVMIDYEDSDRCWKWPPASFLVIVAAGSLFLDDDQRPSLASDSTLGRTCLSCIPKLIPNLASTSFTFVFCRLLLSVTLHCCFWILFYG